VLFGGTGAHKQVRQSLLDDNQLDGVIALPGGVFKPYAGVATAILLFTRGGRTDRVWFYDVASDGRSLDDKRTVLDDHDGDFAAVRAKWAEREATPPAGRTGQCFVVGREEIAAAGYDLSVGRYREAVHAAVEHESPAAILGRLLALEEQIADGLQTLKGVIG
jgi:type I restriction enzyme M protein